MRKNLLAIAASALMTFASASFAQDGGGATRQRLRVDSAAVIAPDFQDGGDVGFGAAGSIVTGVVNKVKGVCIGTVGSSPIRLFRDDNCNGAQNGGETSLDATLDSGPKTYYVTEGGTGSAPCSQSVPCGVIQTAINAAEADFLTVCEAASDAAGYWVGDGGCGRYVVYVGPGTWVENLVAKDNITIIGSGWDNTILQATGQQGCGINFSDTTNFSVESLSVQNYTYGGSDICTTGGAVNPRFTNVGLTGVTGYPGPRGWAASIRGLGNKTVLFKDIITFNVATDAGAQIWWEVGKSISSSVGRCIGGDPTTNRGIGCLTQADCDGGEASGHSECYVKSVDNPVEDAFLQYGGGVSLFVTEPKYCKNTGGSTTKLGKSCEVDGDCTGTTPTCVRGYGSDFNSNSFSSVFQGTDDTGGMCIEGDTKEYQPCYDRCIGGTNAGAKCNQAGVLTTECNTGSCTVKFCDVPGNNAVATDIGVSCAINSDCVSVKCPPFSCVTNADCPSGTCTTGISASSACNQAHTWDCGTSGDASCASGGLWLASENSDGGADTLGWESKQDTFATSSISAQNDAAEFDVKTSGSDTTLRLCGTSVRQGFLKEGNPSSAPITPICINENTSIITTGVAPASPVDGELYYKNASSKWCYWENTAEVCLNSSVAATPVEGGGTGLTSVAANSVVICGGSACGIGQVLSAAPVSTQSVLGRLGSGITNVPAGGMANDTVLGKDGTNSIDSVQIKENFIAAANKSGTGKILLQTASTLGVTSGTQPVMAEDPSTAMGIVTRQYLDARVKDSKCVTIINPTTSSSASWYNGTGVNVTVNSVYCGTAANTATVSFIECTSTDPECSGGGGSALSVSTNACDSDGGSTTGTVVVDAGNWATMDVTGTPTAAFLVACFNYSK